MAGIELPGEMQQQGMAIERMAQEHQAAIMRVTGIRDAAAIQIFTDMVTRRGFTDDIESVRSCAQFAAEASMLLPEAMGLCKVKQSPQQDAT